MKRITYLLSLIFCTLLSFFSATLYADEGGVSFWVPGYFGTLAAAPLQPGLSFASIYYHSTVSAGSQVAFARQVTLGKIQRPFSGQLNIDLDGEADLFFAIPSYTFYQP